MSTFHDFPDAELVVIACLTAGGLTASSALDPSPTWPVVTVTRIGGTSNEFRAADRARIQLDGWGATKASARAVTAHALTLLWALPGTSALAEVLSVSPDLGMAWLPDTTVPITRPRYIAGVVITLR